MNTGPSGMTDITGEVLFLSAMIFALLPFSRSLPKRLAIVGAYLGVVALGLTGGFSIYSPFPVGDWLVRAGAIVAIIGGTIVASSAKDGAFMVFFSKRQRPES